MKKSLFKKPRRREAKERNHQNREGRIEKDEGGPGKERKPLFSGHGAGKGVQKLPTSLKRGGAALVT